jgi:hypothetical protein
MKTPNQALQPTVAERDQPKNKKPLRAMEPRCGFSLTLLAALED